MSKILQHVMLGARRMYLCAVRGTVVGKPTNLNINSIIRLFAECVLLGAKRKDDFAFVGMHTAKSVHWVMYKRHDGFPKRKSSHHMCVLMCAYSFAQKHVYWHRQCTYATMYLSIILSAFSVLLTNSITANPINLPRGQEGTTQEQHHCRTQ